ncbi:hypothetical protein SISSUDRAFT_1118902 [Sistotremastrum suecicum HHB10207 ss-3]|uniref:DUF6534 domain-containing protein n=1 Tax=Sistotremastrum suecicum HHB10207 ss-3 TaxID=1314776 RepID=A0A166EHB7_9AGAM|nr:hypothetical protein SISSUDRAFT_1118902 [Sistotremastrum suecicum HHB10207 ss-3]
MSPSDSIAPLNLVAFGEGSAFICILVSSSLFGVTSLQGVLYYGNFPRDAWYIKLMVAMVMFLSALHTAMCWQFTYSYFIVNFGSYLSLLAVPWTLRATIPVTYATKALYHTFFLTRIWTLSNRNKILFQLIFLVELGHAGSVAVFSRKCFEIKFWVEAASGSDGLGAVNNEVVVVQRMATAAASLSLTCDLLITSSFCYYLHYSRTGYKRTDSLISALIIFTINSGITTAIVDAVSIALFLSKPFDPLFWGFYQITIQIYANALLTFLNTRARPQTHSRGSGYGPELYDLTQSSSTSSRKPESPKGLKHLKSAFDERSAQRGTLVFPDRAVVKAQVDGFSHASVQDVDFIVILSGALRCGPVRWPISRDILYTLKERWTHMLMSTIWSPRMRSNCLLDRLFLVRVIPFVDLFFR